MDLHPLNPPKKPLTPWAKRLIERCLRKHERRHVYDAAPCPNKAPDLSEITYPTGMDDDTSQCHAYKGQLDCLDESKRVCKLHHVDCDINEMIAEMQRVRLRAIHFCSLAGVKF